MSIVDEALQTLDKRGAATDSTHLSRNAAPRVADSVAHELYAGGRPSAPRSKPWPLMGGMALLLVGVAAWWAMDRVVPKVAATSSVVAAKAAAPVAAASVVVPAPAVITPVVVVATAPVPVPVPAPVPAVPVLQVTKPKTEALTEPALSAIATPEWQSKGWALVAQDRSAQALETWETGLGQARLKNRQVVFALAFNTLAPALAHARRLGATAPALVVREGMGGSGPRFRVLLLGDSQVTALAVKNMLLPQAPYLWVAPVPHPEDPLRMATTTPALEPVAATAVPVPVPVREPVAAPPVVKPVAVVAVAPPVPVVPVREASSVQFSVDDSVSQVMDVLARGDIAEATRQAGLLITNQPGRWEGHFVMGSALLASGRAGEAEAPLDRALALQPNSVKVLMQRAIAAQEAGKPDKAVVMLRQARSLAPENAAVWLNLGYSAELSGSNTEAVSAYQRYLQLTNGRGASEGQRAYVSERLRALSKP